MAVTTPGEFRFVRGCFIVATALTVVSFVWLTREYPLGWIKITSAGVVGAIVTISLMVALEWVTGKQAAIEALQSRPQEKAMAPVSIPASPVTTPIVQNMILNNDQRKQLIKSVIALKPTVKSIMLNRSSSTRNNLWMELAEVFYRAGFGSVDGSVQTGFQEPASPDETGVMICIINPNSPSKIDALMKDAFEEIGIKSKYISLSEAIYKGDITIFVGPDPLPLYYDPGAVPRMTLDQITTPLRRYLSGPTVLD